MNNRKYKICYCTPALYSAGGVERVVTTKANYFAEHFGYEVIIIVTEGNGDHSFFHLSKRVEVINLGIAFEDLWNKPFFKKLILYSKKQHQYKKLLKRELLRIKPDITISTLRREINFINDIFITVSNFFIFELRYQLFYTCIRAEILIKTLHVVAGFG